MSADIPAILRELVGGDRSAVDRLLPLVYAELHALAGSFLSRERPGHTLQPTALVHEAYARLVDQQGMQVNDRAHFVAIAARAMRNALVDHARRRQSEKRGGGRQRIPVDATVLSASAPEAAQTDVLALHEALEKLAIEHTLTAKVVEMRYFGGMTIEDAALALGISPSGVEREWRFARAWLRDELRIAADGTAESSA